MKRKIAVPIDDSGRLESHFGHCRYFKFFIIEDDKITSEEIIQPPPHEPGLFPNWLADLEITDLITGGIGSRAIKMLDDKGINVCTGAPKLEADELAQGFLKGTVKFSGNECDH